MIKKIVILGSTGSIGKTLLKIIKKDKKNFEIKLLTAKNNYNLLLKQAKEFKVKNLIITDKKYFEIAKSKIKKKNINIYNNFDHLDKILKKKVDYTMSSIVGINGLLPTFRIIKYSKKIAIANKESIICGWNLIHNELKKNKTYFIPVDSEHFSIWFALKNNNNLIDKIFLTASGGPFYNLSINKFKDIKINQAIKHPNWKMGKKISVDSATMMNKVFEIIEAKNLFNIEYKKLKILNHPKSYIHAIIQFSNGMTKIISHDTNMKIPIFNTLYENDNKKIKSKNLNLDILNNLSLKEVDYKKFPMVKILDTLPQNCSLFETIIVSSNDLLVNLFLNNKIKFTDISKKFVKLINLPEFNKYKKIFPKRIQDIIDLERLVHLKIDTKSI
jgi:1-deoxy-D-xylulose-5-phosphate reductoisomerase